MRILIFLAIGGIFYILTARNEPIHEEQKEISNIELGHYLFFDTDLSWDGKTSCASCHHPQFAFTDRYRHSFNSYGEPLNANASSILNLQDFVYFSWMDTSIYSLSRQFDRPLFSEHPVELGLHRDSTRVFEKLAVKYFENSNESLGSGRVKRALEAYIRSLQCRNSNYDNWMEARNCQDYSREFRRGIHLFFEKSCHNCHGGRDFNRPKNKSFGIPGVRTPSLRNVVLTAPYFHNGREARLLDAILNHPAAGHGEELTMPDSTEAVTLLHFLSGLTDTSYLQDALYLDPHNYKE